ncbi:hypothetical protein F5J12DRAFT_786230 [Pisolithus orientalis]|uniref:uncharacterized protein n=1 Tax=Pisolithus orientalis TaxID=936130 RepID=UPI002224DB7B|nr:uncharacterized protein F5J12DRAFT_786230 [Pisolithus orientalis]KAI5991996.1 hypothetical protein F5J12DRAFT_786230 [Pisolithus orientalis]
MVTTGLDVDSSDVSGKHTDECCGLPTPGKQALENPEPPPEAKQHHQEAKMMTTLQVPQIKRCKVRHWVTWLNDCFHLWKQWRSSGQPLYSGDKGDLSMDVDVVGDRECDARKWDTSPTSQGNIPHTSLSKFHGWTLWLPPIKTFVEFHQCTVWSHTRANTCARNSSYKFHEWTLQSSAAIALAEFCSQNSSCKFHEQTLQSLTTVSLAEFHSWKVQSHIRADTCTSYKFHEWTLQSSAAISLTEFHSWNSSYKFHEQTLQSSIANALTEFHSWNSSCKFCEWTLQSSTAIAITEFCLQNSSYKFHEWTLQSSAAIALIGFHSWKVWSHTRADTCARNSSYKFHEQTLQSSATIALTEFCPQNSNCKFWLTSMEGIHPSSRQPALDKLDQNGPFLSVVSHAFKTLKENLRAEFTAIHGAVSRLVIVHQHIATNTKRHKWKSPGTNIHDSEANDEALDDEGGTRFDPFAKDPLRVIFQVGAPSASS